MINFTYHLRCGVPSSLMVEDSGAALAEEAVSAPDLELASSADLVPGGESAADSEMSDRGLGWVDQ